MIPCLCRVEVRVAEAALHFIISLIKYLIIYITDQYNFHYSRRTVEDMNGFAENKEDPRYKIIIVGDVNVGKTALFWRYIEGQFLANKNTIVTTVDFKMKTIKIDNKNVKLYLWDTAGSEQYRSIVATYFKGCHGVAVVFDLSREGSFKNAIDYWVPTARTKTPGAVFILIGNKSDLDIRVSREEVEQWSKQNGVHYIQTSVKLNKNVIEAFDWLGHRIHEKQNAFTKAESFSLEAGKSRLSTGHDKKCCRS